MATTSVPFVNDPYVGKVFGNVLDFYDNPSYNIKLYMVRPEYADQFTETSAEFVAEDRVAPEGDTVVLAQTGVTANQIDDVVIQSLANVKGGAQLSLDFTITQPGAATFLDEIQYAKGFLGIEGADTTMFLEIRFQGYETDFETNDEGGAFTPVLGPIIYKLHFTKFSVSLDAAGSVYDCSSFIFGTYAFKDAVFRTKNTITTTGATITEHVEDFVASLNEWHTDSTAHAVPDEIEIDLSQLINANAEPSSQKYISDEKLLTSADIGQTDSVNRVMNETFEIRTKVAQQQALADAPVDTGTTPEIQFDGDNLSIKEGTTIEEFMYIVLSMCPEFYSKISRKENIDDVESPVRKDQGFISWFKVHGTTLQLAFDPSRNKYAKKYVYTPVLYKTANPNIAVDAEELKPTEDEIDERIKQYKANGSLKKAYHYIFTGLNDQILDLDISYNAGSAAMLAPKYGAIGDVAQTSQNKISDSSPEGESTAYADRLDNQIGKAKDKAVKDAVGELLDVVTGLSDGGAEELGSIANSIGNFLDKPASEILTALATKAGLDSLFEEITREERQAIGSGITINTAPPTEPLTVIPAPEAPEDYKPEASGFVYSADFIVPSSDQELSASDLAELGYVQAKDFKNVEQSAEAVRDVKSEAEAATTKVGSTRSKLFGFITEQHGGSVFLVSLAMELRGDPWYLSPADLSDTTDTTANFNRDEQLFFLRIASPQKFDPDWRDEDANTGYWKFDNNSRTFTGIYRIIKVTNSFSGGIFTTQIEAQRAVPLNRPISTAEAEPEEDGET